MERSPSLHQPSPRVAGIIKKRAHTNNSDQTIEGRIEYLGAQLYEPIPFCNSSGHH